MGQQATVLLSQTGLEKKGIYFKDSKYGTEHFDVVGDQPEKIFIGSLLSRGRCPFYKQSELVDTQNGKASRYDIGTCSHEIPSNECKMSDKDYWDLYDICEKDRTKVHKGYSCSCLNIQVR
jgi:hypothetical protein